MNCTCDMDPMDCSCSCWTEEQNRRRCNLIDKEINGNISSDEFQELSVLQDKMLADELRKIKKELEGL